MHCSSQQEKAETFSQKIYGVLVIWHQPPSWWMYNNIAHVFHQHIHCHFNTNALHTTYCVKSLKTHCILTQCIKRKIWKRGVNGNMQPQQSTVEVVRQRNILLSPNHSWQFSHILNTAALVHVVVHSCSLRDGIQPAGIAEKHKSLSPHISWGKKAVIAYFPSNTLPWMLHGWHCYRMWWCLDLVPNNESTKSHGSKIHLFSAFMTII